MLTEILGCKINGGYISPGPAPCVSVPYDSARAQKQQAEAAARGREPALPIDISIRRLWDLAQMLGEATSIIESVVDRAHGCSGACGGEVQPDQSEPVTLAEKLERAADAIARRVNELSRQAERARSIA